MRFAAPPRRSAWAMWAPLALILVLVAGFWLAGSRSSSPAGYDAGATPSPRSAQSTSASVAVPDSGLPSIAESALPAPAKKTLALIRSNGPFPYPEDGQTFLNRERVLPRQGRGYYREYTVATPGENDRGPRRIVRGSQGDTYWTTDHYASFRQIRQDQ